MRLNNHINIFIISIYYYHYRFYAKKSKLVKKVLHVEYKKTDNLEESIKTVRNYLVL